MSDLLLSVAEFERLLSRGRGKAILHLKQHDAAPYREVIHRCCLHNTAYDAQSEGTHAYYLMYAIGVAGMHDEMAAAVSTALLTKSDSKDWGFQRLFELAGEFAWRDYENAHQAMYDWCRNHYHSKVDWPGALFPLLNLDSVEAFLFLLDPRQSGHYFDMNDDIYNDFEYFLKILEEEEGEEETRQAMQEAVQDQPLLRATIDTLYARRETKAGRTQTEPEWKQRIYGNLPYKELRYLMETDEIPETALHFLFKGWGNWASDADFDAAAHDFVSLPLSYHRQHQYAAVFGDRPFPLDDFSRLFNMARQTDWEDEKLLSDRFAHTAFDALKNIQHPQIRAFALDMIASRHHAGDAVGLLVNNFEAGDWAFIDSLFDKGFNEDVYHRLGFSIQFVLKHQFSPAAVPALIRMYDLNPCSHCRMDVVESLVSLNALPDWIAEECFYDANLNLRAYAKRGFK